ncbi:HEPN domain-containing protein [Candidatus Woesearchaeota archaeon]|nr:HEPN domain-containing protein [Candidatus Woesearchaeota archaeon]
MTFSENKIQWCLRKAEKEGRKHRGLRKISSNKEIAEEHITKAEHNFNVMFLLIRQGVADWAVSASFYTHYHCLLSILSIFGYESRNQECTFAVIEHLIERGKISLTKEELYKIISANKEEEFDSETIVGLRERFQYGTEITYKEQEMKALAEQTREFIEKTKKIIRT